MNRVLSQRVLGVFLAVLAFPPDLLAGRGGGYGGGGGYRGGGGGGYGGGGYRGGAGGGYGGQMGGGSMSHSPSFSQPHSGTYGNPSSEYPHAAAGGAAAGAGYANHNQGVQYPGAAGAAAGAGYANHNQGLQYPGAAGAAAGAGYAYNHSGAGYGYWNGNNYAGWGMAGMGTGYGGGIGAWGAGSPMYGWGYSGYSNPYYGAGYGSGGGRAAIAVQQPANATQSTAAAGSDYSQPISTTAAAPDPAVAGQVDAVYAQARAAFKAGDYAQAIQLDQQALAQTPNDATMQEFLALAYFAQGNYKQAAAPLYAVLSVRPGWDWTTLSGMYPDVDTYTVQLRALESYVRANPDSAQGHFVLAYQYLAQGHDPNAVAQLKEVVRLQPNDTISAQIIAAFQPAGGTAPPPAEAAPSAAPAVEGKLAGSWTAAPAQDAKITLAIQDDGAFTWTATGPSKPPVNIAGKSTLTGNTLTLTAEGGQNGALVGQVAWKDADNFTFRLVGAPASDPGLKFGR
jgi:hypothetical protein